MAYYPLDNTFSVMSGWSHLLCIGFNTNSFINLQITCTIITIKLTRIVRESDYSPASELFSRVRKTIMCNNPKLYLVNVDAHEKTGQILSIRSQDIERKQNSDVNQGP